MEKWLTYDQVSLIPTKVSSLEHRAEANTKVKFGPVMLDLPLIAAPMPDVSNGQMAAKLSFLGSLGWIHRFDQTVSEQIAQLKKYPPLWSFSVGVAVSAQASTIGALYDAGVRIFCIDTANGANKMVERAIKTLKNGYPDIFIVTGNVASAETFLELESWGADAIRVGIAGGSVCETRTETGVYSPMASVIQQCANRIRTIYQPVGSGGPIDALDQYKRALLIADGGITSPGDMCKALALGADLVMAGGIFAGTDEAPGDVILIDGKKHKYLRGAASYSVQKDTGNEDPSYVEGKEKPVPYRGSVEKVVSRFAAGLRSSMSYMNARNLAEYRQNVKVVEIG